MSDENTTTTEPTPAPVETPPAPKIEPLPDIPESQASSNVQYLQALADTQAEVRSIQSEIAKVSQMLSAKPRSQMTADELDTENAAIRELGELKKMMGDLQAENRQQREERQRLTNLQNAQSFAGEAAQYLDKYRDLPLFKQYGKRFTKIVGTIKAGVQNLVAANPSRHGVTTDWLDRMFRHHYNDFLEDVTPAASTAANAEDAIKQAQINNAIKEAGSGASPSPDSRKTVLNANDDDYWRNKRELGLQKIKERQTARS